MDISKCVEIYTKMDKKGLNDDEEQRYDTGRLFGEYMVQLLSENHNAEFDAGLLAGLLVAHHNDQQDTIDAIFGLLRAYGDMCNRDPLDKTGRNKRAIEQCMALDK